MTTTGTPPALVDWLLTGDLAPSTTDTLAPLYAAAADAILCLPHCGACGLALELEQQVCDGCGAARVVWTAVEPVGTVHSATVVHRREQGLVLAPGPYPVADVELASGHRLVVASLHPAEHAPPIGAAVSIGFRRLGGVAVPAFDHPHTEAPS
jgi:uncharacterized OB-fold protein